jgi:WD40 repeat protein
VHEADPESAAEQAREGVRAWVRGAGRRTRAGMKTASPYAILAFLTASAVAPIAGSGLGAPAEFTTALDQLGGIGSNFLADAMADTAKKLRGQATEDQWREALAAELLPRLAAADENGKALHEEISRVLREVDAINTAISEAALTDEDLRHVLEGAFQELGLGVRELRWMLTDVRESVDGLRQQLAVQSLRLHRELDEVRRHLVAFTREQLPAEDGVPADVPGGAVPPYPGLVHFGPEDAPWFRGREREIAELLGRLAEQAVGGPPLIVTGVSGVGKSSLVRAGLLPGLAAGALGAQAAAWRWVLLSPGVRPSAHLRERMKAISGVSADLPIAELAAKATAAGRRPVIVVDQFEELFTQCPDPAERLAFVTELTNAAPALVVIAVRADFYPACAELPPLAKVLASGHVVLGPLTADAIRRAVIEPAEHSGLSVEPGLPDLLLRDLGADGGNGYEPGALPLLAHALRATWDRREGIRLTVGAYRETGGIRHAIAETAERIYLELPPDDRDRLRDAVLTLVAVTPGGTAVRRRGERAAADSRVLRRLVKARLVTVGADTVEISHEALLSSWPRLAGWLDEAREDLLLRHQITTAAQDWDRSGRDPDLLPRGSRLLAARERLPDAGGGDEVVGAYLAAGWTAAEQEEADRRRGTNRLRRLVAGLTTALLLAVGGGLYALDQREEAVQASHESRSRQYAAEALNALERDEPNAVVKALAGWNEAHTPEALGALLSAQMVRFAGGLGPDSAGWSTAVSPDGTRIAVGGFGTVRLWDARTLLPISEPMRYETDRQVHSLEFSPDGRFLASGVFILPDGVKIWDARTGALVHSLPSGGTVDWMPEGATLLATRQSTRSDGQQELAFWDAETGRMTRAIPAGTETFYDVTVSPDGRYVAETGDLPSGFSGEVRRISDGKLVSSLPDSGGYLNFAPDGSLVANAEDGRLIRWEVPSGRRLADLTGDAEEPSPPSAFTVTGDGAVIGYGGPRSVGIRSAGAGTATPLYTGLWDFREVAASASGQVLAVTGPNEQTMVFRRLTHQLNATGTARATAFSPDGTRIAASGAAGQVRVWDTGSRALVDVLRTGGEPVSVGYLPDGALAITTEAPALEIWGPDGKRRTSIPLPGHPVDLALSRDGSLAAVSTQADDPVPAEVVLRDLRERRERGRLDLGESTAWAVAFSADDRTLHVASTTVTIGGFEKSAGILRSLRTSDMTEISGQFLGEHRVLDLQVAPDGGPMVVTGTSQEIDVRTPDGSATLWRSPEQLGQVSRVAFSSDGATFATSQVNGDVQLWDTATGQVASTLRGHAAQPVSLAFTPDGALLATGAEDSSVRLWSLDPDTAVHRLCEIAVPLSRNEGRPLSPLCR